MTGSAEARRHSTRLGRVRLSLLLLGVAMTLLSTLVAILNPRIVRELDLIGYDAMLMANTAAAVQPSHAVIIDIDEQSLAEVGQWPWPRYRIAELVTALREAGAASIGIDIVLAEPDRTSLNRIQAMYRHDRGIELDLGQVDASQRDNDAILAEAIRDPLVIPGVWFSFGTRLEEGGVCPPPAVTAQIEGGGTGMLDVLMTPDDVLCPTPVLAQAASGAAFLNALPGMDGRLRRMPLIIQYDGQIYPSLALALAARHLNLDSFRVSGSAAGVDRIQIGDRTIPTDKRGNMLLRFYGREAPAPHVSAADILAGRASLQVVQGKAAIIGASAVALGDLHATPANHTTPGVELQAIALDNILHGEYWTRPPWTRAAEVLAVFLVGLFVAVVVSQCPLAVSWAGFAVLLATVWAGAFQIFASQWIYVSPVPASLALAGNFLVLALARIRLEERQVYRRARELSAAQNYAISGLTSLAETRDPVTGRHIIRTQRYVELLARHLARDRKFKKVLTTDVVELMPRCAPLHDIGKVGVPDHILLKSGKLTDDEFDKMKRHTTYGYEALKRTETASGPVDHIPFLHMACEIALTHHEKWDGTGYPQGLQGESIPIAGRIMALADVYDALIAKRCYKPCFPHEKAAGILREGAGKHFDPDIVEAFFALEDEFKDIATRYADPDEE